MFMLQTHFQSLRLYFIKYPVVLSGIIIYSYLFFAIVEFLIKYRDGGATFADILTNFDALPFLWLLAYSLVKIIQLRQRYLESENKRLSSERELLIKKTQLDTLQEIAKAFRHRINTPLTIINFESGFLKKKFKDDKDTLKKLSLIDEALSDISSAIQEFAKETVLPSISENGSVSS